MIKEPGCCARLWKKLRSIYQGKSLRFWLIVFFSSVSVFSLVAVAYSFNEGGRKAIRQVLQEDSASLVSQINVSLDQKIKDVIRLSDQLYYQAFKKTEMGSAEQREAINLLLETSADLVVGGALYSDEGFLLFKYPEENNIKNYVGRETWFENTLGTIDNIEFSLPHVLRVSTSSEDDYNWVISLARSVEYTYQGEVYPAVLLLEFKYSAIQQSLQYTDIRDSGYIYLTDSSGNIIFHPNSQLIYANLFAENNNKEASLSDGVYIESFNKEKRMVTVATMGYTGWKLIAVNPLIYLDSVQQEVQGRTLIVVITVLALMIIINIIIARYLVQPVTVLEQQVLKLSPEPYNNLRLEPSPFSTPEIEHLSEALNILLQKQDELRENLLFEQNEKRKSELEALQAQIHPHFLYNTLDSVIWMIENKRYEGATEMVAALAKFFRLSLAKGRTIIPLSQELEQVRYYLLIQQIRFNKQFSFAIEADDDVLDCKTVKLILQPMVENAIIHGTASLDEAFIFIRAYHVKADLFIDVLDNGLGMNEDKLQKLMDGIALPSVSSGAGSGVGIYNVHKRIKLYFGEAYGLKLFSEPDEGTMVRIHLPFKIDSQGDKA